MKLLIDAHALIWAVDDPARLSPAARAALQSSANELWIGSGTIWELSIKVGLGKLELASGFGESMTAAMRSLDGRILHIAVEHCAAQARLPALHRDPFDRLLAAQAVVEGATVVSIDPIFAAYGVANIF